MTNCELLFSTRSLPEELKMSDPKIDNGKPFYFPSLSCDAFYCEPIPGWATDVLKEVKFDLSNWNVYPFFLPRYPRFFDDDENETWEREKKILAKEFAFLRRMMEEGAELMFLAINTVTRVEELDPSVCEEINLNDYDFISRPPDSFGLKYRKYYRFVLK